MCYEKNVSAYSEKKIIIKSSPFINRSGNTIRKESENI